MVVIHHTVAPGWQKMLSGAMTGSPGSHGTFETEGRLLLLRRTVLARVPLMGRAAVQAYDRAKAYAPDDNEGKMIEIVSRSK